MTYLSTPIESPLYQVDQAALGYIPNYTRVFALRPEVSGGHPADVAVMDFAERVAAEPASVTGADAESLRRHGLSDVDIFQVVLAACVRRFFSGVLTAVGAVPDAVGLDPDLLALLGAHGIENAPQ